MNNDSPFVSIIIPAYNCEKTISKCLNSLLNLNYPKYEIIIVDDGSTDSTPEILNSYHDKIIVIKTDNEGPSHARNIAVNQAKGEYVSFTDSDCIVDNNWLNELLKGFLNEKVAGVGGDQLSPDDETVFGRDVNNFMKAIGFVSDYLKLHKQIIETKHNPTCNVMYKKIILLEAGLFNEDLWPGEDVEIDLKIRKLGYTLYYNPDAIVYHYRPQNIKSFSRMMKRYGWAQAYLMRKYGLFRLVQAEPFVIIIYILLMIYSIITNSKLGNSLVILSFILLILWFLIKSKKLKKVFVYVVFFLTLIYFWNIGFFSYFMTKQKQ